MQVELVAFDGQDQVCAAFGEVGDVLALAAQRVRGDHGVAQVADLARQRPEPGDLVGLAVDVSVGKDHGGDLIVGRHHVPDSSVDGDRPLAGRIASSTLDGGMAAPAQSNAAIIAAGTLRQLSVDIDILPRAPPTAHASPSILGAREAPQRE